jgi:CSLREA domain-containing protein
VCSPRRTDIPLARILLIIAVLLAGVVPATAATITVNSTADVRANDGICTLREAIIAANTNTASGVAAGECAAGELAVVDLIQLANISGSPDLFTLALGGTNEDAATTGDLDITQSVVIRGQAAAESIVQAGTTSSDRVFDILPGSAGLAVAFESLTMRHGQAVVPAGSTVASAQGAGIYLRALAGGLAGSSVTLLNAVVTANTSFGSGGGIAVASGFGTPRSTLSLTASEVSSNNAALGGGGIMCGRCDLTVTTSAVVSNLANVAGNIGHGGGGIRSTGDGSFISISNSTIGDNRSNVDGGGLSIPVGTVTATATYVTFHQNRADQDSNGTGTGGGVHDATGTVDLSKSIVASNFRQAALASDCSGAGISTASGYNVVGTVGGCAAGGTNVTTASVNLSALDLHGGTTRNYAPLTGSPALERVPNASCASTTDQRGVARPLGPATPACEAGAIENSAPNGTVADASINEDAGAQMLGFTVADSETPDTLTASATSSNTTLLSNANLSVSGTGPSRTLTLTTSANQFGSSTISVLIGDGNISTTRTFLLTVLPVNDAPTLTPIGPQTTDEDTDTNAIAFTVSDVDNAASSLTVSGTSGNTTLVPHANITPGGTGASRTVVVRPALNQYGNATITMSVSDGSLATPTDFLLTVNPVNDPPTISPAVPDQSISRDSTTGAITFTIGDIDTAIGSLTVTGASSNTTLVPNTGIALGGSDAVRTVTVTPVLGQSGSTNLTLTVNDGALTGDDIFLVSVSTTPSERVLAGLRKIPESGTTWFESFGERVSAFAHRKYRAPALYGVTNGELHPAVGNLDDDPLDEVVIGFGAGGAGNIAILDDSAHNYAVLQVLQVQWTNYTALSDGSVWPAVGDLDGDGRGEIVVGLGSAGAGWLEIFDQVNGSFAHVAWRQVDWSGYYSQNGETHPAVGDVDGDGRAEIIVGLGAGGRGFLQVLEGTAPYAHRRWVQVSWTGYTNVTNGPTFPAAGDLDGDDRAEVVIGLGVGGGGWIETLEDSLSDFAHSQWLRVTWEAYATEVGETHPAVGNLDGDPEDEIAIGLGPYPTQGGWFQVMDDAVRGFASLGWTRSAWQAYVDRGGPIFPAIGRFQP